MKSCLSSLRDQVVNDFETIIVDNGSTDQSVEFVNEHYPEVQLLELNENMGFAKATNIGIRKALMDKDVHYIVLLNNDIECDRNYLLELSKSFDNDEIGSVCPKMLNYYNRDVLDDTGNIINKKGFPYSRGQGQKDLGQYDTTELIFSACAGAAMYKKEVFDDVGYFDEDFFAYYEDVDFGFKLQLYGYKCIYNPKAVCYHKRGGTTSTNKNLYIMLIERNIVTLRIKNYPFTILFTYSVYYQLARIYRFLKYIFLVSPSYFFSAFRGYLQGIFMIPKSLIKRYRVLQNKKVDSKYIKNIMQ